MHVYSPLQEVPFFFATRCPSTLDASAGHDKLSFIGTIHNFSGYHQVLKSRLSPWGNG